MKNPCAFGTLSPESMRSASTTYVPDTDTSEPTSISSGGGWQALRSTMTRWPSDSTKSVWFCAASIM